MANARLFRGKAQNGPQSSREPSTRKIYNLLNKLPAGYRSRATQTSGQPARVPTQGPAPRAIPNRRGQGQVRRRVATRMSFKSKKDNADKQDQLKVIKMSPLILRSRIIARENLLVKTLTQNRTRSSDGRFKNEMPGFNTRAKGRSSQPKAAPAKKVNVNLKMRMMRTRFRARIAAMVRASKRDNNQL